MCLLVLVHMPMPQHAYGGGGGGVRGQLQESVLSFHGVDSKDPTEVCQTWQRAPSATEMTLGMCLDDSAKSS